MKIEGIIIENSQLNSIENFQGLWMMKITGKQIILLSLWNYKIVLESKFESIYPQNYRF